MSRYKVVKNIGSSKPWIVFEKKVGRVSNHKSKALAQRKINQLEKQ